MNARTSVLLRAQIHGLQIACEQLVAAHLAPLYARHGLPIPEVHEIAPDAPEWPEAASCFADLLDTPAPARAPLPRATPLLDSTPLIDYELLERQPLLALAPLGI